MEDVTARRSFITGLGAALAGTAAGSGVASAQTPTSRFSAARHTEDDWMDALPGQHRMVVDAVTPNGGGEAVLFANNLYEANKKYSLGERDLAIVVVMRHFATPFAFTDAIWSKYGKPMGEMLKFMDPKTNQPPSINLYNSAAYGMALPNLGNTIDAQIKRGAHFAICDVATHFIATQLAQALKGDADAIYKEFAANTVPNSHFAAAGVVAVNRAQERGYTLIYAG